VNWNRDRNALPTRGHRLALLQSDFASSHLVVAFLLLFRNGSILSLSQDEFRTMTELAAFAMALMLTVELGLAIALVVAWLAAR
jgi:hypothetical protein